MARDAIAFLDAMALGEIDLLGFSIGSFVAQEITLTRPALVRRLVLASSAPQGAAGMRGWAKDVIDAVGQREGSPEGYLSVFYTPSAASQDAGKQSLQRIFGARTDDRDTENDVADTPGPVRRGVLVGSSESRAASARECD
jgi:pimeloyl-ACP methyl ester carboxylesterase